MIRSTLLAIGTTIGTSLAMLSGAAQAADDYPTKPVTLYIGYKAGGGTDTIGRVFAKILSRELGQQVNVVNLAGAGGAVACMKVARSKPDGYTLLMNPSSSLTAEAHVNSKVNVTVDDFEYGGMLTDFQSALAAPKDAPFNSFNEFIDYAKKNPGIKYAALSPFARMAMQVIAKEKGLDVNYVPVKGGAGMITVLLGKQVDLAFSGGLHARHPNEIKTIVGLTSDRLNAHPDMPTLKEEGIKVSQDSSTTLFAPKGTPDAIMNKIEAAIKAASIDPTMKDISAKTLFPINFRGRSATLKGMKQQWEANKTMVQETGYKAN